jgi:hypothetical protein
MTETIKVLGHAAPIATTETSVYVCPDAHQALVSSITICNRGADTATVRCGISVGGGALAAKDYLWYDLAIPAKETFAATLGLTMGPLDDIRGWASTANCSFAAFGSETDPATLAAYTAAELLALLVTVDGTGSAVDADKLDGVEGAGYAVAAHTHTEIFPFCMILPVVSTDSTSPRLLLPYACTIVGVRATVSVAPTGADLIVDVHKDGTTIFTTAANRPTIAAGAYDSIDWAAPDVTALSADSYLTVNIDQVGSTIAGGGLTVMVRATRSA